MNKTEFAQKVEKYCNKVQKLCNSEERTGILICLITMLHNDEREVRHKVCRHLFKAILSDQECKEVALALGRTVLKTKYASRGHWQVHDDVLQYVPSTNIVQFPTRR